MRSMTASERAIWGDGPSRVCPASEREAKRKCEISMPTEGLGTRCVYPTNSSVSRKSSTGVGTSLAFGSTA